MGDPVSGFNEEAGNIVYGYRDEYENKIYRLTPGIKNNTAQKQYSITPFRGADEIYRKEYGNKPKQKKKARKYHFKYKDDGNTLCVAII